MNDVIPSAATTPRERLGSTPLRSLEVRSPRWVRASLVAALLALGALACSPSPEPPCGGEGVICPLAGNGVASFNGDGKPASKSGLYLVSTVRRGPDGLVHLMDFNNHRVRRIDTDGVLRTAIGNGIHAVAAEGAAADSTPLENPIDFDFDGDGATLFVSYHDPRILRVGSAGVIEVLAGSGDPGDDGDDGPPLLARFDQLSGVAVAPDGAVVVSDDKSHRVRALRGGMVVAIAGASKQAGFAGDGGPATAALLDEPRGLAFDADGNLYVADSGNHRIRRIDAKGVITTVVGDGEARLAGDGGPALSASLQEPQGLAFAEDGAMFVADSGNHRIRRIDASGVITTVAGTAAGYAGDGGPAIDAALRAPSRVSVDGDRLFVADQRNHVARIVHLR